MQKEGGPERPSNPGPLHLRNKEALTNPAYKRGRELAQSTMYEYSPIEEEMKVLFQSWKRLKRQAVENMEGTLGVFDPLEFQLYSQIKGHTEGKMSGMKDYMAMKLNDREVFLILVWLIRWWTWQNMKNKQKRKFIEFGSRQTEDKSWEPFKKIRVEVVGELRKEMECRFLEE